MEIASYGSIRDSEICRTCLLEFVDQSKIYYLDSVTSTVDKTTIRHKLRDCIPELDLNITPNAAICQECLSSINSAHSFKKKCLQTEKSIKRYIRRTGTVFVDLAQLVEHNKKSHHYLDLHPVEIKQEPGISESHTYTRFFVKQEPIDTPPDLSDNDSSFYQDDFYDYLSDCSAVVKQERVEPESHNPPTKQPKPIVNNNIANNIKIKNEIKPEQVKKAPSVKILPNNNNNQKKTVLSESNHKLSKEIEIIKLAPNSVKSVENKVLSNCAITLKEVPKIKNSDILSSLKLQVNSKIIQCKSEPLNNDSDVKKVETQETQLDSKAGIRKVNNNEVADKQPIQIASKPQTKPVICNKRPGRPRIVSTMLTGLVTPNNFVKPDPQPKLEKPENIAVESEMPEKPQVNLELSNKILHVETEVPVKPPTPPKEIKTEPVPVTSNCEVEKTKDTETSKLVTNNPVQPLPVSSSSPPPLVLSQNSEPPKLVKIECNTNSTENTSNDDRTKELGYNIDPSDLPPLVPLQSDSTTNFDDGITHLECTPNIADYVNDEADEEESLHKCNDCEYECKNKTDFIVHLSTHLEEKFGIKPEPLNKKRDLFGRIKTLGGKFVYECPVCNYRTALKRRYSVHMKLHEENKLLKCTQCNYLCATKSNLNVHMAVHTGHKPHKCTECGYSTVSKSALIVHTRIHTGDRPYSCGVCGYCTISKSALIVHNRIHTGSKPYRCPTCNYRTITKSALTVHMRTHTGDKPFKCHLCDYSTRAKSALNVHVRIHEGYKPYQCTECEYRCSQRSGLNVHMRVHTGDKPFQCTECDYKCSNKSSLVVHNRTHTGETPYKCQECDYTTAWKSALNVHSRIHGDRKPFRCTECDYKCAQRSTLNVHMRIHTGDKPYQCPECDYRCRYQGNLKMHMRVHTRETPFKCSLCDYSTTAKSALIVHFRIHTGEKPFKCTECSYKCSTKSSLKIHMRIHTGETPYECKRCLYKASSNSALKVHLRIHTGEKPFKCSYCSYRASNKGSIKVHLRVHTGETPYECSVCDYKTTAKSALIVHMRTHTGDKPYKCEECSYRCNNKSSLKVHLKVHTGRTPYRCEICDYRCKKKFVLKRHMRVHRQETEPEDNESVEPNEVEVAEHLVTVKNEVDESITVNEEEGESMVNSGYEGDLDISNIQPEFSVIAV